MNIHCICVVKNEADVIQHALTTAQTWADYIYVLDNGSSDGTWEIVQSLRNDTIIPWKQDTTLFHDSIRSTIFQQFRHNAKTGDWWCRLDADEFYCESPRTFLESVPSYANVVWGIPIEYYLTSSDLSTLSFTVPIEQLLPTIKHYNITHTELRFFRDHQYLHWKRGSMWPNRMGPVANRRIMYRHYKYRSPDQIMVRINSRLQASAEHWWHSAYEGQSWRDMIVSDYSSLRCDDGSGYDLGTWKIPDHQDSYGRRALKRVLFGLLRHLPSST